MVRKIATALGEVSSEELGLTLPHEHLTYAYPGWHTDPRIRNLNISDIVDLCCRRMNYVRDTYGVKTIVDCTQSDLGHDTDVYKAVQEATGVNVIVSTGFYTSKMGANYYWTRMSGSGDITPLLYDMMMGEITEGIDGTDVKAGVIKVATGPGQMTGFEEAVLRAAGRVNKDTGVPIITHTDGGTLGDEQAKLLISEGANPKQILISHMDLTGDVSYVERTLSYGVFVGFDSLGVPKLPPPPEIRLKTCLSIFEKGYRDQIMVSNDYIMSVKGFWNVAGAPLPENTTYTLHAVWDILFKYLKENGIAEKDLQEIQYVNPRRFFEG